MTLLRIESARFLSLWKLIFAMVLLAGDVVPGPACSCPSLQLLVAVCLGHAVTSSHIQQYWKLRLSHSRGKSSTNL